MKKVKIGIVGCGAVGLQVAKAVENRLKAKARLTAICDIDEVRIEDFLRKIKGRPHICSLKELIKKSDFVVEAASKGVSGEVAKKSLAGGKNVLVMSVGGLLNRADIFNLARKKKARLYIPSGALAGLDGLKGASIGRIDKITLTTRKSPKALEAAPYLIKNNIDVWSLKGENVVFEGSPEEAVKGFPKNINVAATLKTICAAGMLAPMPALRVRIIAAPGLNANVHEIEAQGEFGRLFARTENLPSPDNPKTSHLAALSAIATLEGALDNIKIGT